METIFSSALGGLSDGLMWVATTLGWVAVAFVAAMLCSFVAASMLGAQSVMTSANEQTLSYETTRFPCPPRGRGKQGCLRNF